MLLIGGVASLFAQTKVSGQLTGEIGEKVVFYQFNDPIGQAPQKFEAELNEDGTFSVEIPLDSPASMMFMHKRERTSLFLYPGEALSITLDVDQFDETLSYTGEGQSALASNFLAAYFLKMQDGEKGREIGKHIREDKPEFFKNYRLTRYEEQLEILDAAMDTSTLPKEFLAHLEAEWQYEVMSDILASPGVYAYYQKIPEDSVEIPANFTDFIGKAKIENPRAIATMPQTYFRFLDGYIPFVLQQELELSERPEVDVLYDYTRELLQDDSVRVFYLANVLMSAFQYGDYSKAEAVYEKMIMSVPVPYVYRDPLDLTYEELKKIAPGQPAPAFALVDQDGKEVSLESLAGTVLYVDFWASWCGPCRYESPYAKELQAKFANKPVTFVYISLDEDEEAWRKALEEEGLKGVHLWAKGFDTEVAKSYNVKAIPNYFIIGADGNIFENRPDRPSGENIVAELNKAIAATKR